MIEKREAFIDGYQAGLNTVEREYRKEIKQKDCPYSDELREKAWQRGLSLGESAAHNFRQNAIMTINTIMELN
jgi:hypothetical protein